MKQTFNLPKSNKKIYKKWTNKLANQTIQLILKITGKYLTRTTKLPILPPTILQSSQTTNQLSN